MVNWLNSSEIYNRPLWHLSLPEPGVVWFFFLFSKTSNNNQDTLKNNIYFQFTAFYFPCTELWQGEIHSCLSTYSLNQIHTAFAGITTSPDVLVKLCVISLWQIKEALTNKDSTCLFLHSTSLRLLVRLTLGAHKQTSGQWIYIEVCYYPLEELFTVSDST